MQIGQSRLKEKVIIPVAAGKGGVGKSFLTANLAFALAGLGCRTIAVDLDLGGSNLHSFLGLPNRFPGVGDFLKARSAELENLLVPTENPNLRFLAGDGKTPFMANIAYAQKTKLLSHIKKLSADYILLDLGAGSSFNTLDFFRLSPWGLLMTTPEPPAIMGMMVFLKNFMLRAIERKMSDNPSIRSLLREMYKQPIEKQVATITDLQQQLAAEEPEAAQTVADFCKICRPRIVFNRGAHPDEISLAHQISKSAKQILGIEVDYFGYIFNDRSVRKSVLMRQAFLPNFGESLAAEDIIRIAERIVRFWSRPIPDSAALLQKNVVQAYEHRQESSAAA